ncbi:MAG: NAD(+) synthase, partial [Bacilli bacterium]
SLSESEHDRRHQNTFGAYDSSYVRIPVAVLPFGGYEPTVDDFSSRMKKDGFAVDPFPFVPKDEDELRKRAESILSIQANGLVTRVRKTGLKNLVIGVSGGLDSTLALLVMAEARKIEPSIKILGYTLPSKGATSSRTKKNAIALMKALSVDEIHEVPIGVTVKKHLQDIGHPLAYEGEKDTCYENAQARMRTYILMDIANMRQGLVVGTGDLSELALGWCTYNGDHMSMYGVNCSIPKTLVKYLVKAYSQFAKDRKLEEILLSIIDTPITPELVPTSKDTIEQKTEEVIGKYDLNDFYLFHTLRYGEDPATVLALSLVAYPALSKEESKKALKNFYLRFYHSQFKRSCLPDGPKVGSLSLSPRGDWRMPSDASPDMVLSLLDKA